MERKPIWDPKKHARYRHESSKLTGRLWLLGILSIILFLLIALSTSSSFKQTNYVDLDKTEPQEVEEDELDYSGEDSGYYEEEEEPGEEYEKPLWSPEDDPNYENGLAKLLRDRGAVEKHEAKNHRNRIQNDEKPSYMFSLPDLKKLVRDEIKIYGAIKSYLLELENRVDRMKRWVKDYEESTIKAAYQAEETDSDDFNADPLTKLVTNPIVTHRMIRRFSKDLNPIMELVQSPAEQKFLKEMNHIAADMIYPDVEEDYIDSIESLLRIQHYNNYTTQDMKDGKLGTLQTNTSLAFPHAYDLAIHSHFETNSSDQKVRTLAIEWMEMALKLYEDEGVQDDELKHKIKGLLAAMVKSHDNNWAQKRNYHNEWYFDNLIGSDFGPHLPQRPRYRRELEAIAHRNETTYSLHTRSNFRTLCSGRNLKSEAEKAQLKCWYDSKIHPYWTIRPIKKEALSLDPELYQMYDILSPGAIKYIIEKARPAMTRSMVINLNDPNKNEKSKVRTSSQTWLFDNIERDPRFPKPEPQLAAIGRLVEYSSGLNVVDSQASESIQVASYGSSHHYDEHMDALVDPRRIHEKGDRIATYMFYLTDVEVGGKTAFPVMGTAASPVAGSAVIWYNLKKNGNTDYRTYHGGCPIVYGQKWVANKWILSYENWNKRPCSLISTE